MRVKEVMVGTPISCNTETNLASAVEMLWIRNCGMLPVVGNDGKVVGVVTDRDICIALGTRDQLPGEVTVGEVMSGKLFFCAPDDDVRSALDTMRREKVRRLPVVGNDGIIQGVLSMDDLVHLAGDRSRMAELTYEDVLNTFKAIYTLQSPRLVQSRSAAA
jgi:CBS domain-containing protein